MDQLEKFQWNGDVALDGEVFYTTGEIKRGIAEADLFRAHETCRQFPSQTQKRVYWEGNIDMPKLEVHLPRKKRDCDSKHSSPWRV